MCLVIPIVTRGFDKLKNLGEFGFDCVCLLALFIYLFISLIFFFIDATVAVCKVDSYPLAIPWCILF